MSFDPGAKSRLTAYDLARFPSTSLFDRIARTVCGVGRLPRKELYEAWEVARRVRRVCRGGRIVDVGGGHGLLAQIMLLLDDSSPSALVVDPEIPPSAAAIHAALRATWPRLHERVHFERRRLDEVALTSVDVVVSAHACGRLTDRILLAAAEAHAAVAVLPCCHDLDTGDAGPLRGWLDGPLAIDVIRATGMDARGYAVRTQTIPNAITPKNRLLIATPRADVGRDASWRGSAFTLAG